MKNEDSFADKEALGFQFFHREQRSKLTTGRELCREGGFAAQNCALSLPLMDQIVTGSTGRARSVGTMPHHAVQHVSVPPKPGAGGSVLCAPSAASGEGLAHPEDASCPLNEAAKREQVSAVRLFGQG